MDQLSYRDAGGFAIVFVAFKILQTVLFTRKCKYNFKKIILEGHAKLFGYLRLGTKSITNTVIIVIFA